MISARYDVTGPVVPLEDLKAVHVVAVGGAGMSAVARLLLQAGVRVTGSDAKDSPMLRALADEGVEVHLGHDARYVEGVDTIVVSSAVRDDNVELSAARAAGVRVLHRSQALASLMADKRRAAVAGANGKTTTTSMLTVALLEAGLDPSYAIGGELAGRAGGNARLGSGDAFVVEADESDGSFLAYRPDVAIVTNVQPDHLDFYGTFDAVQEAYARFAATIRDDGMLVACADDAGSAALAERARGDGLRVITYGFAPEADLRLVDPAWEGMTGRVRLVAGGVDGVSSSGELLVASEGVDLVIPLPGEHNLLDAAAAYVAAVLGFGVASAAALEGLAAFGGTRRRFELRGEAAGVQLIDDYAHNAGKVTAVVAAARRLAADRRLVAVFQPHLYSRTRDFAAGLGAGLAPADVVVVLDVYGAREDPIPGVSGQLVADAVTASGGHSEVHFVADRARAADEVAALVRSGDVLLTVGAGDVTDVGPAVLDRLQSDTD